MLQNTFGVNDLVNVTFEEANLTGSDATADAITGGQKNTGGGISTYDLTITFNSSQVNSASKEFLAETMMHEVFHAYLTANPTVKGNLTQHNYMIQNYVNMEVAQLRQDFPPLSLHDAQSLVLAGYGEIQNTDQTAYNAALAMYNMTDTDVAATNKKYKSGQTGTHCN